jgi:hypothetical protein
MHYLIGAVLGYLAGILTPGVINRLRNTAKKDVTLVEGEVKAAQADIKAEAKKL